MSEYNYIIPIDENECIGDSLDTINFNYKNLDAGLTIQTAAITPLSASNGIYYNIGTNLGALSARVATLSSINGVFEYLEVSKDQNDTNFVLFTNFTSGSNVEIINRYATLSSGYINGNIVATSYADIVKTIQGDFILNNADGAGEMIFGTNDTERVNIKPDGQVVVRETASSLDDRVVITKEGYVSLGGPPAGAYLLTLNVDSAVKPGTTTWQIFSDSRIKENIQTADIQRCYDIVKDLPLKRFTWKNEIFSTEQVSDRSKIGWVAQDVQNVFPKAVKENTQTFKSTPDSEPITVENCLSINADQVYAALYGAVQQLITIVEQQSAAIINLQNQLQNS